MNKLVSITLLVSSSVLLLANAEVGCNAIINSEPVGCSSDSVLNLNQKNILSSSPEVLSIEMKSKEKSMKISSELLSVETIHDGHEVLIKRTAMKGMESCPPFCIEPLTINGVTTVGELETLAFIDKLKEKKGRLLIDVRVNKEYTMSTIPGAINLPAYMLEDKSPYQEEVLKLLGAKKIVTKKEKTKWYFKETHALLIFGQSATHNEASTVIKKLLDLGYPEEKVLYYRAGIESWKTFGLTTI